LLVKDFAGSISFVGGTSFQNCTGIQGSSMLAPFLSASYVERGFKARVLAFQRYSFWSVKVAGLKFIGNVAYNYTGPGLRTQRPRLLNFTAADFQAKQITPVVLLLSDV